ncbi:hypothetical protein MCOR27_001257 [Pyricularia oryzae]|uniref:ABC1 atypical kinase-like domain-containing protein n=2 Tax=Pyricularia TaxID=48558 RepID=A0ABQ8NGT5_PYRGI|nr:hypothetical protein MCOR01_007095 [Pyricularia oryzae]KAI6296842.1 hypothetical protein MCOR33_006647 [Pyricularia grisea]KAH9434321.1 hypothetical protein MCOR02_006336 [Pyricularia oryzae]KAI6256975.1 hypothetical protein MCOR19_006557 [Pyricularia oryzae]KAI6273446.1 hypothetical protein MCOR26_006918 [Pyricularia oryzae]
MKLNTALGTAASLGRLRPRLGPSRTAPSVIQWTCASCRSQSSVAGARAAAGFAVGNGGRRTVASSIRSITSSRYYRHASTTSQSQSRSEYQQQQQQQAGSRRPRGSGALLLATTGGAASVGILAFTDDIKAGYETVERCGRVGLALAVCINDYRSTLKKRDGLEDGEEQEKLLSECHKRCAVRTLKVLEKNGGIFIKLGQHLSAMNYLLPMEWTTTFIPLQDRCPVSSFESIQAMYRADTGNELWDDFSEFSSEPIGAASLAQVHLATLKADGRRVAVKVQHPGLAQWAPLDLALTRYTFQTLKTFFPEYDLSWLSDEMDLSLPQELDFRQEAHNANRTREYFSAHPELPLIIPDVIKADRRILIMANESGHRLDDLDYLDGQGIDRDEVSAALARIFNEMIFGDGAPLHCDPHGGNIAIRKREGGRGVWGGGSNFEVILYDHGLYRDIPLDLRRSYAKMWLAVVEGDMDRMRKYAHEVAGVTDESFPLFASAITGRDFGVLASSSSGGDGSVLLAPRSLDEKQTMGSALQGGLLADLVQLLGKVPRIILLILKTNDLTRSLDENLHTRQGPVRSFLILARYCTRTVFLERLETLRERGSLFWPPNAVGLLAAWVGYLKVEVQLEAFEMWLSVKRCVVSPVLELVRRSRREEGAVVAL